jgi:hypothetical protein
MYRRNTKTWLCLFLESNCWFSGTMKRPKRWHRLLTGLGSRAICVTDGNQYWTNSTELSPSWEANSHSASQYILRPLWDPKFHYCVHKSPSLIPVFSQMHPVHTFPHYVPNIHSNIILLYKLRSSEWSLHFRFYEKNFLCISHLSNAFYMTCPLHSP